jgi:hypothetical protein
MCYLGLDIALPEHTTSPVLDLIHDLIAASDCGKVTPVILHGTVSPDPQRVIVPRAIKWGRRSLDSRLSLSLSLSLMQSLLLRSIALHRAGGKA